MDSETGLSVTSAVVPAEHMVNPGRPVVNKDIDLVTPDFNKDNDNEKAVHVEQVDGGIPDPPKSILKNKLSSSSVAVGEDGVRLDGGKKRGKE